MAELDAEEAQAKLTEIRTTLKDNAGKSGEECAADLTGGFAPGPETDLIPDEDQMTPPSSGGYPKKIETPRTLIEDEKREHGRIAWPVWRTYLTVRWSRKAFIATDHGVRRWVAVCGVRQIYQQVVHLDRS